MKALVSRLTGRMPCVCVHCGETYGAKPCVPEMDGLATHGVCAACTPVSLAAVEREVVFSCRPDVGAVPRMAAQNFSEGGGR